MEQQTDDPFWVGWDSALEAVHNAIKTQWALGYNSHSKCEDVLLDVESSIKELRKVRESTIGDLTEVA